MVALTFIDKAAWNRVGSDHDAVPAFLQKATQFGLQITDPQIDGKIYRVKDNRGNSPDTGWYVLHQIDGVIFGAYGSWLAGRGQETFCSRVADLIEDKTKEKIAAWFGEANARLEKQRLGSRFVASAIINSSVEANPKHSYLVNKRVCPHGILQKEENLLIPAFTRHGDIVSYQTIQPDGTKRYQPKGSIAGAFYPIGKVSPQGDICVCEGFATGATIHEVTKLPVFVAFDAGNLIKVAMELRAIYPNRIVICADNDAFTKDNPGLMEAKKVCAAIPNCIMLYPEFKNPKEKKTDFNDLYVEEGAESVNKIFNQLTKKLINLTEWTAKTYFGTAPEIDWLSEDSLPCGVPGILAGVGGIGKSFLALQACLDIAAPVESSPLLFGGRLAKSGPVVMITSEDSRDSVHRRLDSLDPTGERRTRADKNMSIVPLPSAGGVQQIVTGSKEGFTKTPFFTELKQQLIDFAPRLVILDPLQAFTSTDINSDPAAGQYIYNCLSEICAEAKTSIIIMHHMTKDALTGITSLMQARQYIRGSSALVDGARWAYAMWHADETLTAKVGAVVNRELLPGDVVCGGIVKANDKHRATLRVYVRKPGGLLEDISERIDVGKIPDSMAISDEKVRAMAHMLKLTGEPTVAKSLQEIARLTGLDKVSCQHLLDRMVKDCGATISNNKVYL